MGTRKRSKPYKQARIIRAEPNTSLSDLNCLLWLWLVSIQIHLAEQNMRGCKARIQLNRFFKGCERPLATVRPHTHQTKREVRIRITRIKNDGLLCQFVSLLEILVRIRRPAKHCCGAQCDR